MTARSTAALLAIGASLGAPMTWRPTVRGLATSPAELDQRARQRRRARQTHPRKRGRP